MYRCKFSELKIYLIEKKNERLCNSMPKFEDLSGKEFGRWKVIRRVDDYITPSGNRFVQYECECSCKNRARKNVLANALKSGKSSSCGCIQREKAKETAHQNFSTHSDSKSRLYRIWAEMRKRCNNKKSSNYKNYGARGVSICKEWDDFETFKKWAMDNGYNDTLSIDRINVNGDYSPNNCRWANSITQNNNRRTNHYVTHNEETHTVAEWARILDVPYKLLHKKIMKYGENIIGKYLK